MKTINDELTLGKKMKLLAEYERATRKELKNLSYDGTSKLNAMKGGRPQYGETYEQYKKRKGLG
jgi:hypothetical protein